MHPRCNKRTSVSMDYCSKPHSSYWKVNFPSLIFICPHLGIFLLGYGFKQICKQNQNISCLNFSDETGWFLSLGVFGLLSSSLLLFPQHFGRYVLRHSSGVCRTQEPSWNFEPRPPLKPWRNGYRRWLLKLLRRQSSGGCKFKLHYRRVKIQEFLTLVRGYGKRNQNRRPPVVSIKDVVRSSVKVPEFDKYQKIGGHIGRNVVEMTIKMKTIVRKPLMIKIRM